MSKKSKQSVDLDFLTGSGGGTNLSGLFAESVSPESTAQRAILVGIDRLLDNPLQPRLETHGDGVDELAQVIRSQGFQGVLVARPHPARHGFYQLTAGHRRREAARRAGLTSLPIVVRDFTDDEMVTLAITENIQREDLTALEEGKIYLLMAEEMGYTHEQIAREIGKKRGYVENRIRVARAPRDVQGLVQRKPDSIRMVANLIKVKDEEERAEIIDKILKGHMTVEDLPGYIEAGASSEEGIDGASATQWREALQSPTNPGASYFPSENESAYRQAARVRPYKSQGAPADEGEQGDTRIGRAKLAAALRYLTTYRKQALQRKRISAKERAAIAQIRSLVEELHSIFGEGHLSD